MIKNEKQKAFGRAVLDLILKSGLHPVDAYAEMFRVMGFLINQCVDIEQRPEARKRLVKAMQASFQADREVEKKRELQ